MIVQEIMTRDPYVAFSGDSLRTVTAKLAEADVRHLPIVQGGVLVGMISDRDLREVVPSARDLVERPHEAERALARPIATVMSSDVVGSVSYVDALRIARELLVQS